MSSRVWLLSTLLAMGAVGCTAAKSGGTAGEDTTGPAVDGADGTDDVVEGTPDTANDDVSSDSTDSAEGDTAVSDSGDTGLPVTTCEAQDEVPCIDQSIAQLALYDEPNPAKVVEEGTAPDFLSWIDATGGGFDPTLSYVYLRFTDTGLEVVAIGDEDAFDSTDWDFAVRRFVLRLNSGVGGPSCVTVARTAPNTDFEALASVPEGLEYRSEEYFAGESCEFVSDTSGIGAPGTAMGSYWSYPGCVQMTGNVYVVQRADGRHVKAEVLSFYPPDNQDACQKDGTLPAGPTGGGNLRMRWSFLD